MHSTSPLTASVQGTPIEMPPSWQDDGFRDTLPAILAAWARAHGTDPALTVLDHRGKPHARAGTLTWRELDRRTGDLAAFLRRTCRPGQRAALLMDQGADYVVALLGVIRAGLIAVPLFPPARGESCRQLANAVLDADPSVILTTSNLLGPTKSFVDEFRRAPVQLAAVDTLPPLRGGVPPCPEPGPDDLACLQYQAQAVGRASAVMFSQANLVAGARQAAGALGIRRGHNTSVSWLPLFEHLGLLLGLLTPLVAGIQTVLLHPSAFHDDPLNWLRALANYPGAVGAAPNAAYAFCVSRIALRDRAELRLHGVAALADVGDSVRPEVANRFTAAFAEYGLRPWVYRPCYGLVEATALVAATEGEHTETAFYRAQLALGRAVPTVPGEVDAVTLVAAGVPRRQQVCVVDTATRTPVPDGRVGEIWVSGPNVARGYWRRSEASTETFCVLLAGAAEAGEPCWWLRTGDLGVQYGGQLYVTGRVSDVLTVDGRSHYPQDVEATAESAHPAIAAHQVCAFTALFDDGPRAVLVAERATWVFVEELDEAEVAAAIRRAVAVEHGLALREVLLLGPGLLPRTPGGTAARARCRERYLAGGLGSGWQE
ncbi:Acyl-CoA synthetase (AMP-forming)/AMP-acid ligase II [Amycolatopsis marina]|uniref:Acyl-CoA synthetase (AMP-forming)/AMP-acid ligase II n=1 Tax=Amycolatopsis marina TaxID=490629 RepID=A0A1I1CLI8_9PSEU|nr:AMP-binding protein [Amycolatopsis marina]SFB62906.1 Acyl-CoA synthetase (AMP-forming)/AMP-acid ligase II [Amycolatopsis marina]